MRSPRRPPLLTRCVPALVALALTGCFRVSFVDRVAEAKQPAGTTVEERGFWQHKLAYGLVNLSPNLDLRDVCGGPPERVQTAGDVLTTGLSLVSLGLYTPRKIYVTCPERRPQPRAARRERP